MVMEYNIMQMVINIKVNLWMDLLKVTENIFGLTDQLIKVISSKDVEMGMVFGKQKMVQKNIKVTIW